MIQRSSTIHRVIFASLVFCLVASQLVATKHSVDHFSHDSSPYCLIFVALDSADAPIASLPSPAQAIVSPRLYRSPSSQAHPSEAYFYNTRAPPLYTLA